MYQFFSTLVAICAYTSIGLCTLAVAVYLLYPAITYDLTFLLASRRIRRMTKRWLRNNFTIVDRFEQVVENQGDKTFILHEGREFTYSDINRQANRMMNYLLEAGEVGLRDPVCMLMINEPLFVSTWLALGKCGAIASLLNTNIRGASLMHCIKVSESKMLVCSNEPELLDALLNVKSDLDKSGIRVFVVGADDKPIPEGFVDLTRLSLSSSEENNKSVRKGIIAKDSVIYMYTSGTTGLPKAINYKYSWSASASNAMAFRNICQDDVFYVCLPLYHSSPLVGGIMNVIRAGATVVLRKKFSVREFWNDVRRYRVTFIQYIGETARYLVQAPRNDLDGVYPQGTINMAVGNGLPGDIWPEFKERFNIQRIHEFYGASDGNFVTHNMDGREGAVGRITPLLERILDVILIVECGIETAGPMRGPDGLCIQCPRDKAGLLLTKVSKLRPVTDYVGKGHRSETRLVRDVREKGDCYYNSGDLLLMDDDGYLYFKDRLGNTFRWKGENVATTEVEQAILENPQVEAANVYGVKIEGRDGRAGMAALVLTNNDVALDGPAIYDHTTERLPNYACPKFLRIQKSMETTGTFKLRKVNLVKEGFDPLSITDPLYYMDDKKRTYSILDENSYNDILSGVIKM